MLKVSNPPKFSQRSSPPLPNHISKAINMKIFTIIALFAVVSTALPWDSPYEKGCCASWRPWPIKKCFDRKDNCDLEKFGPY